MRIGGIYTIALGHPVKQMQERNGSRSSGRGAGSAGIATTRRLHDRSHSVLLIEAMERVGGRAHTLTLEGLPLDLGCCWLHSAERNVLARLADVLGYTVDHSRPAWQDQLRDLGFPTADQREAWRAYEAFENVLRKERPLSTSCSWRSRMPRRYRPKRICSAIRTTHLPAAIISGPSAGP